MNIHLGAADTGTPSRELPADLTAALYVPAFGRSLPVLLDVWLAAGGLLGMSRFQTYEAVKRNDVPSIRVGGRIKVPTAMLLDRLGTPVETTPQSAAEPRAIAALA